MRHAYSDFESRRRIAFGSIDDTASAPFSGNEVGAYAEGGVTLFEWKGFRWQPMTGLEYTHSQTGRFTEGGATALDLKVPSKQLDSLVTSVGMRAHGEFEIDAGYLLAPEIWALWSHDWLSIERRIQARLRGNLVAQPFTITGIEPTRDSATVGLGWSVRSPENLHLFFHY